MTTYKFRKNATIGNLDAENDSYLDECFLKSEMYDTLLKFDKQNNDFTRRIIVGRTGSGKTALLKKLSNDQSIKENAIIEAESTVFEHIQNNIFISNLMNKGVNLRVFYKSLWIHVLLVKIIDLLYNHSGTKFYDQLSNYSSSKKKKYNIDLAREYVDKYRDNFFNDNIVSEITERMEKELSGKLGIL